MNNLLVLLRNKAGSGAPARRPVLIMMVMAMMILPLPPFILDLLFTFNISLSVMILLVAMFTKKPLDFAAFPAVLLFATLLRLALNVASTRVVLLHGHKGPDAAGKVIEAFGHFLVGGNFAVGIVVFVILIIINFMVITKGAGRIAEVGARFTLDAMPGKQMAIDADLNAGLIGEDEARRRRTEVGQEAEFYGSMDGASKFVRGDAVAGLLIMVINVAGGLIIGVAQHDLGFAEAGRVYTLLTIGDGLVAQIPALVISTAAGVVVSRVATEQDVGQQMVTQLFSNPAVLYITAGIMALMGLIPNMPHVAFLLLAAVMAGCGWSVSKRQQAAAQQKADEPVRAQAVADAAAAEDKLGRCGAGRSLGLEVGYRLISLVDHAQNGELLHRIRSLRKKFAQDVGFLRRWYTSATISNSSQRLPHHVIWCRDRSCTASRANGWRSIQAVYPCSCRARPPQIRPSVCGGMDRRQPARTGADCRLHRSGREYGDRHPSQPSHASARRASAGAPGGAAIGRAQLVAKRPSWSKIWCPRRSRLRNCKSCCAALLAEDVPPRRAHNH